MARETRLERRDAGLRLAEKHYRLAIDILSPNEPYNLDDLLSPSSIHAEDEDHTARGRPTSYTSFHSSARSSTSLNSDFLGPWTRSDSPHEDAPAQPLFYGKHRPTPIITINAARAYHEEQFFADLCAFISLVQAQLQSVRELRTAATPEGGFRSRSSTLRSRPNSRGSSSTASESESEMEQIRWARRQVEWRPRFDPSGIRKLCSEALLECV